MSSGPDRRLPPAVLVTVAILLILPVLALVLVNTYARSGPTLWGFPFFYWYQMLWVVLAAATTAIAYKLVSHARRDRSGK